MRILIADADEVVRKGVRALLETQPEWRVVAEVGTASDAVAEAVRSKPDVVILDVSMPDVSGIDATAHILATDPHVRVLVYTFAASEELVRDAISAGAAGYVLKSDDAGTLISAVKTLAA